METSTNFHSNTNKPPATTSEAAPRKRKHSLTTSDDPETDPCRVVSDHYQLPYHLRLDTIHRKQLKENRTPLNYRHGPRKEFQYGPLIGYAAHAALLKDKLNSVAADRARLEARFEADTAVCQWARDRLHEHEVEQGSFLCRRRMRGEDGMAEWLEIKGATLMRLMEAERRLTIVRREARAKRLIGIGEE